MATMILYFISIVPWHIKSKKWDDICWDEDYWRLNGRHAFVGDRFTGVWDGVKQRACYISRLVNGETWRKKLNTFFHSSTKACLYEYLSPITVMIFTETDFDWTARNNMNFNWYYDFLASCKTKNLSIMLFRVLTLY